MLSDELSEAVRAIEEYEKDFPESYVDLADDIRKIKLEMMILRWRLDMGPPIEETITPTDLQWVRAEAWKRGSQRPPFEFADVFEECMPDFWAEWKKTNDLDAIKKRYEDRMA
jgi:hypothetical protein